MQQVQAKDVDADIFSVGARLGPRSPRSKALLPDVGKRDRPSQPDVSPALEMAAPCQIPKARPHVMYFLVFMGDRKSSMFKCRTNV